MTKNIGYNRGMYTYIGRDLKYQGTVLILGAWQELYI